MDARKYDAINHVAAGQFKPEQRQRLEAFTAANALLSREEDVASKLTVAEWIVNGPENIDFWTGDEID